jgi:hypothetical protein
MLPAIVSPFVGALLETLVVVDVMGGGADAVDDGENACT